MMSKLSEHLSFLFFLLQKPRLLVKKTVWGAGVDITTRGQKVSKLRVTYSDLLSQPEVWFENWSGLNKTSDGFCRCGLAGGCAGGGCGAVATLVAEDWDSKSAW